MISRPWNCVYTECSPVESSVNQTFISQVSSENGARITCRCTGKKSLSTSIEVRAVINF